MSFWFDISLFLLIYSFFITVFFLVERSDNKHCEQELALLRMKVDLYEKELSKSCRLFSSSVKLCNNCSYKNNFR